MVGCVGAGSCRGGWSERASWPARWQGSALASAGHGAREAPRQGARVQRLGTRNHATDHLACRGGGGRTSAAPVRAPLVQARPGSRRRGGLCRARRARRDADRSGQVALLPAARPGARRAGDRGLPARRADARPGRRARGGRAWHGARAQRVAAAGRGRLGARRARGRQLRARPGGARALRRPPLPRAPSRARDRALRRRRGPLPERSGATTSAPTTCASPTPRRHRRAPHDGADGDRDPARRGRHRARPAPARPRRGAHGRRPPEPDLRRRGRAGRASTARAARAGLADPAARPAIVYAGTRARCEEVAERLREAGLPAGAYHAGLGASERDARRRASWPRRRRDRRAPPRSAWASTRPTCAPSGTGRCPRRWRATTRSRAARPRRRPARCVLLHSPSDRGLVAHFIRQSEVGRDDVNALLGLIAGRADSEGRFAVALEGLGERARALVAVAERIGAVALEPGRVDEARGALRLRAVGHRRASEIERRRATSRGSAGMRSPRSAPTRPATPVAARCCCGTSAIPTACTGGALLRHLRAAGDLATRGIDHAALRAAVVAAAAAARPPVGRTGLDQILRGLDRVRERYSTVPGFGSAVGLGRVAVLAAIDAAVAEGALCASGGARPVLLPPGGGEEAMPMTPRMWIWSRACATGGSSARGRTTSRPMSCSRTRASTRSAGGFRRMPTSCAKCPEWAPRASRATAPTCSRSCVRRGRRGLPGRPSPYDARQ